MLGKAIKELQLPREEIVILTKVCLMNDRMLGQTVLTINDD
jgi:diketogulonate reductase-like aldo/keto reductase